MTEHPPDRPTVERVAFDGPRPDNIGEWLSWLRQHSIDPHDVAIPGWIERDDGDDVRGPSVRWLSFVRDANRAVQHDLRTMGPLTEVKTIDLALPAAAFPPLVRVPTGQAFLDRYQAAAKED